MHTDEMIPTLHYVAPGCVTCVAASIGPGGVDTVREGFGISQTENMHGISLRKTVHKVKRPEHLSVREFERASHRHWCTVSLVDDWWGCDGLVFFKIGDELENGAQELLNTLGMILHCLRFSLVRLDKDSGPRTVAFQPGTGSSIVDALHRSSGFWPGESSIASLRIRRHFF
ncbi:unnamed protein product [Calypogeia fissa]